MKKPIKSAGLPPANIDPGEIEVEQPAKQPTSAKPPPAKKKSPSKTKIAAAASVPPDAPAAKLNGKVEYRDPAALKDTFADAVRKHTGDEYRDLKASIKERGILQPLLITPEGEVIEGNGRARAAQELGLTSVPCVVVDGLDGEQAWGAAVTLNADRRHLTREEKDRAIRTWLDRDPTLSDREIAKRTHTSHANVADKRKKLVATGQIPQSDERHDRNGVARPASANQKRAAKAASKTSEAAVPAARPANSDPTDSVATSEPNAADEPEELASGAGNEVALLVEPTAAVDALEPKVQEIIDLIRDGGDEAPDRADVTAVADTFAQFARDLNGAFARDGVS